MSWKEKRSNEYTFAEADRSVHVAEIHAHSILALDRSDRPPVPATDSKAVVDPLD